jgi:hypothetical protein
MSTVARPKATLRFYVEGREVDGEAFWRAVRALGGRATITAHPPKPLEGQGGYRLTERGRAALERQQGEGQ